MCSPEATVRATRPLPSENGWRGGIWARQSMLETGSVENGKDGRRAARRPGDPKRA